MRVGQQSAIRYSLHLPEPSLPHAYSRRFTVSAVKGMAQSQTIPVDEIAEDYHELQEKVKKITGKELTIEPEDTIGHDFLEMDPNIRAVFVRRKGEPGAFRVTGRGDDVQNIVTGPNERGAVIVVINPGQVGMCFGHPSFRRFIGV
ncbi:hypothetical protein BKA63DRAFT_497714 [Paraphoma chrysanthemicola]|nr:hypothetical protein BKA63DRAFT_497714 [Paraphoma chrysanthemicola]